MIGDIQIHHLFVLKDVLYVPEFDLNLISVSSLTKRQKLMIHFTCDHAFIQDIHLKKMIGKADKVRDLYVLHNKPSVNARIHAVSMDTWHKRLGHPSNNRITLLKDVL